MRKIQYLNVLFLLVLWGANIYAVMEGFFINDNSMRSPIAPASYTYIIWGLIYVLLTGFTIYQFTKDGRRSPGVRKIEWMFIVSVLLNAIWLYVWENKNYILSVIILLVYFLILANIYIMLEPKTKPINIKERLLVRLPFTINFAWVTLALAVNLSNVLNIFGVNVSLEVLINVILLGLVLWITYWNYRKTKDFAFLGTITWGMIGIVVNLIIK